MSGIDDATFLSVVRDGSAALAAIPADRLDRPVRACPGWTVADLLDHVGQVQRWCAALLEAEAGVRVPYGDAPRPAEAAALGPWLADGATAVCDALAAEDRDRLVGSWAGRQPVAWWIRRLAHETWLHGWDAANATDRTVEVDPAFAVDGIDELFDVFVPRRFPAAELGGRGETIHLHATDAEGEWLVRFDPQELVVTREHAKGDVAARGAAADLLLFLWSRTRPTDGGLEVFGDAALLDRWQAAANF